MDVIFKTLGRKFSMEIGFFDTILEIKEKIQKHQVIPVPQQTLVFNGQLLENNLKVINSQIVQGSHIDLIIINPEKSRNQVADDHGKKIRIVVKVGSKSMGTTVYSWDAVGRLRAALSSRFPIPPDKYFFVHNGVNVMEDDGTFQWHDVHEGDTIEVKSLSFSDQDYIVDII